MAAVDATDCGIDGTVIWASREEGRLLRAGTRPSTGSVAAFAATAVVAGLRFACVLEDAPVLPGADASAGARGALPAVTGRLAWAGALVFAAARWAGGAARRDLSAAEAEEETAPGFAPDAAAGLAGFAGTVLAAVAAGRATREALPATGRDDDEGAGGWAPTPVRPPEPVAATCGAARVELSLPNPIICKSEENIEAPVRN